VKCLRLSTVLLAGLRRIRERGFSEDRYFIRFMKVVWNLSKFEAFMLIVSTLYVP
jgi:hypothetical protein